ncbi:MAG: hypothetical protein JNM51_10540 [Bacteroidia bacterium]|nr:hypothetical protein [Bacteroidia bacterium]
MNNSIETLIADTKKRKIIRRIRITLFLSLFFGIVLTSIYFYFLYNKDRNSVSTPQSNKYVDKMDSNITVSSKPNFDSLKKDRQNDPLINQSKKHNFDYTKKNSSVSEKTKNTDKVNGNQINIDNSNIQGATIIGGNVYNINKDTIK